MSDLVSIVVPVRNRAAKVRRAIRSIQSQSYEPWEALVVDDGSTDDTWEELQRLASEDDRIRLFRHETSRGAQAARNTGIRPARGEWIAFLDSDDEWFPESLRLRLDLVRSRGVQVVHSAAVIKRPGGAEELFPSPVTEGSVYAALLRDPGPMFPALIATKAAFERIGYLDESIVAYQEWDTAIRLARHYEFGYVPEPTFMYDCTGDDTMSKGASKSLKGFQQIMKKHRSQIWLKAGVTAVATDYVRLAGMAREAGDDRLAVTYDRRAAALALPARVVNKGAPHLRAPHEEGLTVHIGVVPVNGEATGGVYQYSTTLAQALDELRLQDRMAIFFAAGEDLAPEIAALPYPKISIDEQPRTIDRLRRKLSRPLARASSPDYTTIRPTIRGCAWARGLRGRGLDLMIYPTSNTISFEVGIPYIVAIHDLQHRLQPEFPEVSADGEWESREYDLGMCIEHATLVLVDSQVGKEDVLQFYGDRGISEEHVVVLPFLPATYVSADISAAAIDWVLQRYDLTPGYLFYPAQFWPHKNHVRIVEAVARLRNGGLEVTVAFSGSHTGALREKTFAEVREAADRLGVSDLVRYLGRVSDDDMSPLYAASSGLVMPTFFGPTNIPPLEAFTIGRPVITSDIRGIREQMDGAALLVDPRSSESIAEGIRRLLTEPGLADELVRRGHRRVESYTRADYLERLREIVETARRLVERA